MSEDRYENVKSKLDETKSSMIQNLSSIYNRDEEINEIVLKTEDIVTESQTFNNNSNNMRNYFRWKFIILALIFIIIITLMAIIITIVVLLALNN